MSLNDNSPSREQTIPLKETRVKSLYERDDLISERNEFNEFFCCVTIVLIDPSPLYSCDKNVLHFECQFAGRWRWKRKFHERKMLENLSLEKVEGVWDVLDPFKYCGFQVDVCGTEF